MERHVVARAEEIPPGGRKIVRIAGRGEIGIFNVDGAYYALKNTCAHQGARVCLGKIVGTALPQIASMVRGFNLLTQLNDSKTVIGLNLLELWDDRGTLEPWTAPLATLLLDGTIVPVVHAAIPFAEAPEAHRILAARENVGKVVLVP